MSSRFSFSFRYSCLYLSTVSIFVTNNLNKRNKLTFRREIKTQRMGQSHSELTIGRQSHSKKWAQATTKIIKERLSGRVPNRERESDVT